MLTFDVETIDLGFGLIEDDEVWLKQFFYIKSLKTHYITNIYHFKHTENHPYFKTDKYWSI